MKNKTLTALIASYCLTACLTVFAGGETTNVNLPFEEGSYKGVLNNEDGIHIMVRSVPGRTNSMLGILFRSRENVCAYMIDPTDNPANFVMTPLYMTPDGEIGQTNADPSLILQVENNTDRKSPKFSLTNSGTNTNCIQGSLVFKGRGSSYEWLGSVQPGSYKLPHVTRKAGNIGQPWVEFGDTSDQATLSFTAKARKAGQTEVREKAPGLFTVKDIQYSAEGTVVSQLPYRIGFFVKDNISTRFVLVNPSDSKDVYDLVRK